MSARPVTVQARLALRLAFNFDLLPAIAAVAKGVPARRLDPLCLHLATTIFTLVVMVFVYFIGHLQAMREYWLQEQGATWMTQIFLAVVALLFPSCRLLTW
jgi:hypothetical protein